ncbi:MAG: hypothetical protein FJ096_16290, partial [Deltaproteobacteria bacterium]|nr:hypothetical protein [Deltaproteobacteria bacterium]
ARWAHFIAIATEIWHRDRRHIAPVLGHGELPDGERFVAFGLSEGRMLTEVLAEHPLEPAEWLATLRGICRALEAAHRHDVVHGALSTTSVCVGTDADGQPRARVLDLGSDTLFERGRARSGTTSKDIAAREPSGVSGDLRMLGELCFESLCGVRFEAEDEDDPPRVSDVRPELGPHFDEPVHALMVRTQQPESAAEAHAQMVQAARRAGYDVGNPIPSAPREASGELAGADPGRARPRKPSPRTGTKAADLVGPALFGVALVVLAVVLFRARC